MKQHGNGHSDASTPAPDARILLVSMRGGDVNANRCFSIEVEDVIQEIDAVDRLDFTVHPGTLRNAPRALFDQYLPRLSAAVSGASRARREPYDLVLVSCGHVHDLRATVPLRELVDAGTRSACLVEEIWAQHLPHSGKLNWLKQFDYLFTSCSGAVDALEQATGRPTAYLPPSVNTVRWSCPDPAPERCIDIFWYGRRVDTTHEALKRFAADNGLFYLYDTRVGSPVIDKVDHRVALSGMVQRARCVYVNPAKADREHERGAQLEIGYRFFEAAAGGAVLVGDYPRTPVFDELFGWEDVIFEIPMGSDTIDGVVAPLLEDDVLRQTVSTRNRMESIRRHDALYRWEQILRAVDLPESPGMHQRRARLDQAAAELERRLPAAAADLTPDYEGSRFSSA